MCLLLCLCVWLLNSKRLLSVVIHGFDGLFLEIVDGTRSVMITDIAFLKSLIYKTQINNSRHIHLGLYCRLRSKRLMSVDQYVDNTIFGDMKNNTKQFWSYLKSKKQDSQGVK
jgi:hypothetical protein